MSSTGWLGSARRAVSNPSVGVVMVRCSSSSSTRCLLLLIVVSPPPPPPPLRLASSSSSPSSSCLLLLLLLFLISHPHTLTFGCSSPSPTFSCVPGMRGSVSWSWAVVLVPVSCRHSGGQRKPWLIVVFALWWCWAVVMPMDRRGGGGLANLSIPLPSPSSCLVRRRWAVLVVVGLAIPASAPRWPPPHLTPCTGGIPGREYPQLWTAVNWRGSSWFAVLKFEVGWSVWGQGLKMTKTNHGERHGSFRDAPGVPIPVGVLPSRIPPSSENELAHIPLERRGARAAGVHHAGPPMSWVPPRTSSLRIPPSPSTKTSPHPSGEGRGMVG